jgi:hypothetical protein
MNAQLQFENMVSNLAHAMDMIQLIARQLPSAAAQVQVQKEEPEPIKKPSTDFLTPREAADYLHVTTHTLTMWRRHNKGPDFIRVGCSDRRGRIKYSLATLDKYLSERINLKRGPKCLHR